MYDMKVVFEFKKYCFIYAKLGIHIFNFYFLEKNPSAKNLAGMGNVSAVKVFSVQQEKQSSNFQKPLNTGWSWQPTCNFNGGMQRKRISRARWLGRIDEPVSPRLDEQTLPKRYGTRTIEKDFQYPLQALLHKHTSTHTYSHVCFYTLAKYACTHAYIPHTYAHEKN